MDSDDVRQVNHRFLKLPASPAAAVLFLAVTHAGIQAGALTLAYFHARLTPTVALGLVVLALLGGLVVAFSHREPTEHGMPGPAWLLLFPVLAAVGYGVLFVRAASLPDYSWDGNTYHIPPMNCWARAGYVHWVPVTPIRSELMNGYPKGAELLT